MSGRVWSCVIGVGATLLAPAGRAQSYEDVLRGLHAKAIEAHVTNNVDLLLEDEAEDYLLVSRGEVSRPTLAERRALLGPYLRGTAFEEYRDVEKPIVRVSADGSLGWVIVTVRARGLQKRSGAEPRSVDFTSAWIELYERRDGRWLRVGNVSNFKE